MYLEEYIAKHFTGKSLLMVATYPAACIEAVKHQSDYDVVIGFNPDGSRDLHGLEPTHWCVNLDYDDKSFPDKPLLTPFHEKWGKLSEAVGHFRKNGAELIHPQAELLQFEFDLLCEVKGRALFPTSGVYLLHRLVAAGVKPALVGFTGYADEEHHDPTYECMIFDKLEAQGLLTRISVS